MIDYKTWRQLNESLGFNLGVASPNKVGVIGAFQYLDEKKKRMDADVEIDKDDVVDDVDGDEDVKDDVVVDDDKDCGKMMMSKKKSKKKMKNECACDDKKGMGMKGLKGMKDMPPMDGDMGDDMGMDDEDMDGGDMDDVDDEDIENAEEESGEDLDGDDEMGEPEDHIAKIKAKKAPMPLGFMKKKMKKESVEDMLADLSNAYLSPKNQMGTEEEFLRSMKTYNYDPKQKFDDGMSFLKKEDLLIPAPVVEQPAAPAAPAPGEVGFAPQQKMDMGYELPPLEEGKKPRASWLS